MELYAIRVFTPEGVMRWFVEGWFGDRGPDVLTLERDNGAFFTTIDAAERAARNAMGPSFRWEVVRLAVGGTVATSGR